MLRDDESLPVVETCNLFDICYSFFLVDLCVFLVLRYNETLPVEETWIFSFSIFVYVPMWMKKPLRLQKDLGECCKIMRIEFVFIFYVGYLCPFYPALLQKAGIQLDWPIYNSPPLLPL